MHRFASILPLLSLAAGCVGPVKSLFPPAPGGPTRTVHLITHGGLHTGIAAEWSDVPAHLWPVKYDYPNARYLEVGWGDDDGYRKDLTAWIALKALCWPTRSVIQLEGFTNSVVANFDDPQTTIIEIKLSERGFERLCRYVGNSHVLDAAGRPIPLGDDWYRARGKYCVCKTCNTWVASALRAAGCPISPAYCITRGPLLFQARKFGKVLAEPAPTQQMGKPSASKPTGLGERPKAAREDSPELWRP